MSHSATYDPADDKIRIYPAHRLDSEDYARAKATGFRWAPKQELFFAMWSPGAEDLAIELAGEIDDEDKSLVERAENRAERFEGYSDKRMSDAERAREGVAAIADGIPLGQPILVGHHSERRARKDAERIENGMRKAVKMWETSQYWTDRADGAIRAAKYKELPGVRRRRIKTIEADKRRVERAAAESAAKLKMWSVDGLTLEQARKIATVANPGVRRKAEGQFGYWSAYDVLQPDGERYAACPSMTVEQVQDAAKRAYSAGTENRARWIAHYDNRLAYERAMLAEAGIDTGRTFAKGGEVEYKGAWLRILRVNRGANGEVNSLTCEPPSGVTVSYRTGIMVDAARVGEYRPPEAGDVEKARKAAKLPPLCNYPGEGFREMTEAEWKARSKWSDFPYIGKVAATAEAGAHRRRQMPVPGKMWEKQPVFITDAKIVHPPKPKPPAGPSDDEEAAPAIDAEPETIESQEAAPAASHPAESMALAAPVESQEGAAPAPCPAPQADAAAPAIDPYEAMRQQLKAGGVKVTAAAQLFPTPRDLAARVAEEADLQPGLRILEPSAGTGRLIDAAAMSPWGFDGELVGVEINPALASALLAKYAEPKDVVRIRHADFLECGEADLGTFDRVIMNPPFADQADIRHVMHAAGLLRPGGRLVALMSAGVEFRQDRRACEFRAYVESMGGLIEPLPPDSFKEAGTSVNACIVTIEAG